MSHGSQLRALPKLVLGGVPFLVLLIVWQAACSTNLVKPFFLPSPAAVLTAMAERAGNGELWRDLWASFYRVGIGYVLAVLAGVPVGIALGANALTRALGEPFNNFARYTPLPAFIPLVILWVGLGDANAMTVVFLGTFWSFVVLVADAISAVPKHHVETALTLGLGRWKCLWHVVVPHAMPGIYDALRVGSGWAWSSLVLAEVVGANVGVGHMLMESQRFLKTANVIGGVLLVGVLGLLIDHIFGLFYQPLFPWTERARKATTASPKE
jgi:NitT/TauT family transport system permease protein